MLSIAMKGTSCAVPPAVLSVTVIRGVASGTTAPVALEWMYTSRCLSEVSWERIAPPDPMPEEPIAPIEPEELIEPDELMAFDELMAPGEEPDIAEDPDIPAMAICPRSITWRVVG